MLRKQFYGYFVNIYFMSHTIAITDEDFSLVDDIFFVTGKEKKIEANEWK